MKINIQKLNPFKKKDQKRDQSGKFTAGSGGLSTVKKFNLKRNAPVIAIVALVGGVLVYRSFAGVSLYRYQYSAYQCPSFSKDAKDTNASNSCVNNSAEGLTYRLYEGIFGREPDDGGYKYWTQKMAGDRTKPSEVAKSMLDAQSATAGLSNQDFVAKLYTVSLKRTADKGGLDYYTGKLDKNQWTRERLMQHFAGVSKVDYNVINLLMTASDNQTFVEQLYASLFGRQGDDAGVQYWTNQINQGKQGKNNVLAAFAASSEAVTKHGPGFANYVSSAPKVEVVQTAKKIRDERLWNAALNANAAKKAVEPVSERVDKAKGNQNLARTIASKSKPTRSDLSQIGDQEKTVRAYLSRSQDVPSKTGKYLDQNRVWYVKSVDVAKYSPDLSADEVKKEYDKTLVYHELAKNGRSELSNLIKAIQASYKTAESKYEAEQNRIAAEQAASEGSGSAGTDTGGDFQTCPDGTRISTTASCPRDGMTEGEFRKLLLARCRLQTGEYRYRSARRHVTYTITYRNKAGGSSCVIDASTKRYKPGTAVCDSGYRPSGTRTTPACSPPPRYPDVPYRLCGHMGLTGQLNERCISLIWHGTDAWGQRYTYRFYSCKKVLQLSVNCKNEYGNWRYVTF